MQRSLWETGDMFLCWLCLPEFLYCAIYAGRPLYGPRMAQKNMLKNISASLLKSVTQMAIIFEYQYLHMVIKLFHGGHSSYLLRFKGNAQQQRCLLLQQIFYGMWTLIALLKSFAIVEKGLDCRHSKQQIRGYILFLIVVFLQPVSQIVNISGLTIFKIFETIGPICTKIIINDLGSVGCYLECCVKSNQCLAWYKKKKKKKKIGRAHV
eukprot:TRINITY_DN35069_c1_g1_i1.p3 TRINITY_DN35069_c1_g1~~TRINITY_DN35069_c1_g1_i1.p3  ORF type:complete len:209 (+),score=-2.10 TRINITY_DN35069_c1_g1_i1:491-1117(+)